MDTAEEEPFFVVRNGEHVLITPGAGWMWFEPNLDVMPSAAGAASSPVLLSTAGSPIQEISTAVYAPDWGHGSPRLFNEPMAEPATTLWMEPEPELQDVADHLHLLLYAAGHNDWQAGQIIAMLLDAVRAGQLSPQELRSCRDLPYVLWQHMWQHLSCGNTYPCTYMCCTDLWWLRTNEFDKVRYAVWESILALQLEELAELGPAELSQIVWSIVPPGEIEKLSLANQIFVMGTPPEEQRFFVQAIVAELTAINIQTGYHSLASETVTKCNAEPVLFYSPSTLHPKIGDDGALENAGAVASPCPTMAPNTHSAGAPTTSLCYVVQGWTPTKKPSPSDSKTRSPAGG